MLWLNLCGVITKSNRIGGGKRVGLARASQVPPQFIVWTIPRQHESQIDMPQARYDLRCLQVGVEAATSRCNTAGTVGKKAKLKAEAGVYPTQAGSADVGRLKLVAENRLLRPVGWGYWVSDTAMFERSVEPGDGMLDPWSGVGGYAPREPYNR